MPALVLLESHPDAREIDADYLCSLFRGSAERPTGGSTPRDRTGVDPQDGPGAQ